jgi:hypothetical protein
MIYLGPSGHQVAFDLFGIGLLLGMVALLVLAVCKFARRRRATALWAATAFLLLGLMQTYRGVVAPERAWPTILAAIQETSGAQREQRVVQLQQVWQHGTVRAVDWYALSKSWDVCHELWTQQHCRQPVGQREAVGIAREVLEELASKTRS